MARKTAGRGGARKAARKGAARKAARGAGRDDRSDYRNKVQAQKVEAADKKGCLSNLFVLALPFLAVGAFLILHS